MSEVDVIYDMYDVVTRRLSTTTLIEFAYHGVVGHFSI